MLASFTSTDPDDVDAPALTDSVYAACPTKREEEGSQ